MEKDGRTHVGNKPAAEVEQDTLDWSGRDFNKHSIN